MEPLIDSPKPNPSFVATHRNVRPNGKHFISLAEMRGSCNRLPEGVGALPVNDSEPAKASLETVVENGVITHIRVTCRCGEVMEIECQQNSPG